MKQSNYLGGTLLYAIMSLLFLIPLSAYAQNYQLKGTCWIVMTSH